MKYCKECNSHKYNDEFYSNTYPTCKICARARIVVRRRENRIKLLELFGDKCSICGYDKCLDALQFHHIDDSSKLFTISNKLAYNLEQLIPEAKKCILLCANCHIERHSI